MAQVRGRYVIGHPELSYGPQPSQYQLALLYAQQLRHATTPQDIRNALTQLAGVGVSQAVKWRYLREANLAPSILKLAESYLRPKVIPTPVDVQIPKIPTLPSLPEQQLQQPTLPQPVSMSILPVVEVELVFQEVSEPQISTTTTQLSYAPAVYKPEYFSTPSYSPIHYQSQGRYEPFGWAYERPRVFQFYTGI